MLFPVAIGRADGGANPSFAPQNQTIPMESLLDRSEADNRGVKKTLAAPTCTPVYRNGPLPHQGHGQGQGHTVMAGEANKKGGIFDRLTNENSYTGVSEFRFHVDALIC